MEETQILAPKSSLGIILKIIIGVVVVAVIGIGTCLATRIWDPLWNPFRPEPEKVLEEAFLKMKDVKTLHSETILNIKTEGTEPKKQFNVSLTLNNDLDDTDSENIKSAGQFNLTTSVGEPVMAIDLSGEHKVIEKASYFKLDEVNLPSQIQPFLMMYDIDLNKIQGQWIASRDQELSKEQQDPIEKIEKINKLFEESKICYVKEELKDEKINGSRMYHYLLALDNEELKKTIQELVKISVESSEESSSGFGAEMMARAISEAAGTFLDKIGEITSEIWISKKDNFPYRIKLEKDIELNKLNKLSQGKVVVNFGLELSNFNKPVTVKAPENFIGIEEIIKGLSPELGPFPAPQQMPSVSPHQDLLMEREDSYLLQASLLKILFGLLK